MWGTPPALPPGGWSSGEMPLSQCAPRGPHADGPAAVDAGVYLGRASLPPGPASGKHHVPPQSALGSLSTEAAFCNQF